MLRRINVAWMAALAVMGLVCGSLLASPPTAQGSAPAQALPSATPPAAPTITPFGGAGTPVPVQGEAADLGILPTTTPLPTATLAPPSRFTLLLMGGDRRPNEPENLFRTDVLMLISLDRTMGQIGVLSIPRDLYVTIPGYRNDRINAAYLVGQYNAFGQYVGLGGALAKQAVEFNFGMPVDAYVAFDFEAFIALIDMIAGIDVVVEEPIADPAYPSMDFGYEPFYLDAGPQHLDGETALKYVRSRHNSDDRARMQRQQQVVDAVRTRIEDLDLASALIEFAPVLWTQLNTNVDTDLTLDELLRLASEIIEIAPEDITYGVLTYPYVYSGTIDNQDVLVPDFAAIQGLMFQVFGPSYAW